MRTWWVPSLYPRLHLQHVVHDDRLLALRADRDDVDRDAEQLLRCGGCTPAPSPAGPPTSGSWLVGARQPSTSSYTGVTFDSTTELAGIDRQRAAVLGLVRGADLDRREVVEHVEARQHAARHAVDQRAVARRDGVEPAGAPRASRRRADLRARALDLQDLAGLVEQLASASGRCRRASCTPCRCRRPAGSPSDRCRCRSPRRPPTTTAPTTSRTRTCRRRGRAGSPARPRAGSSRRCSSASCTMMRRVAHERRQPRAERAVLVVDLVERPAAAGRRAAAAPCSCTAGRTTAARGTPPGRRGRPCGCRCARPCR